MVDVEKIIENLFEQVMAGEEFGEHDPHPVYIIKDHRTQHDESGPLDDQIVMYLGIYFPYDVSKILKGSQDTNVKTVLQSHYPLDNATLYSSSTHILYLKKTPSFEDSLTPDTEEDKGLYSYPLFISSVQEVFLSQCSFAQVASLENRPEEKIRNILGVYKQFLLGELDLQLKA